MMTKRWLCGIVCGWLVSGSAWAGYDEDFASSFGMGMGSGVAAHSVTMGYHWARMPIDVSPDHATQSNVMTSLYAIYDQTVSNMQAAGVVPFGIVNPRTNTSGLYMTGVQYGGVVSNLVERYDGDGVNDMPGLTYPVRVWELVNEYSSTTPGNPGNSLPRTNFISMVTQGCLAIRSACPQAWFAYDPFDTNDTQALLQQMAYTNIDVISFHTYAPLDKPNDPASAVYITNTVHYLRGTLGMTNLPRVWITEYAFYDHKGSTPTNMVGTQTDNARWFVQTTAYALGSNLVERFIYTELSPPSEDDARLRWMTPMDTNGVRRQLYYAYAKMAALIDRASVRQPLALGAGVYGYRFTANGTNVVVAWSSETNSPHTNVVITGLGTNTQGILMDAVPDTNGVFTSTNVTVSGGQYTIASLSSNPVYLLVSAGTLAAPTGVSAGDGAATDRVQIVWADGSGASATGYQVWRHTLNSSAMATLLGATAATNYTDTTVTTGVMYYYWIKATNAALVSAFSAVDSGYAGSTNTSGSSGSSATNAASPLPVAGDFDGDDRADFAVYNSTSGVWTLALSAYGYADFTLPFGAFGGAGYTPVAGDFDGDDHDDFGIYRESSGDWTLMLSAYSYTPAIALPFNPFGASGNTPVTGDFDGDGYDDFATVYRAAGNWLLKLSAYGYTSIGLPFGAFGGTGYTPLAGDFDGDDHDDLAIYQDATGNWTLMLSDYGYTPALSLPFNPVGGTGYAPVAGDFDGDGRDDFVVFAAATGVWQLRLSAYGYTSYTWVFTE